MEKLSGKNILTHIFHLEGELEMRGQNTTSIQHQAIHPENIDSKTHDLLENVLLNLKNAFYLLDLESYEKLFKKNGGYLLQ